MNNYYTPDIEDIRVGYECEMFVFNTIKEESFWKKHVLTPFTLRIGIEDKTKSYIRTPYLSQEQIEAEGWIIKEGMAWTSNDNHYWFEKGNYCGRLLKDGRLVIIMKDVLLDDYTEKFSNGQMYLGKCPSINEFRTICKLLGI